MQHDKTREKIRQAIVDGADNHRIAQYIVDWSRTNARVNVVKLAAVAQIAQVLNLSQSQAEALVSEFLV